MTTYQYEPNLSAFSKRYLAMSLEHLKALGDIKGVETLVRICQIGAVHGALEKKLFWTGSSSASISVPQADEQYLDQLEVLQHWYIFRGERTKILSFLERYPFLVHLLVDAYYNIQKFFPYSLVYLTVATDPEDLGTERLIAFIATKLDPDDALDTLSDFDKKWWLNALKQARGKLTIALEFQ